MSLELLTVIGDNESLLDQLVKLHTRLVLDLRASRSLRC
jgi:hypothetical protein